MSAHQHHQRRVEPGSHQTLTSAAAQVQAWLDASTHVLIGAGAGLSAAAGVDYTDEASFARLFPPLVRKGFRARYELIGYDDGRRRSTGVTGLLTSTSSWSWCRTKTTSY